MLYGCSKCQQECDLPEGKVGDRCPNCRRRGLIPLDDIDEDPVADEALPATLPAAWVPGHCKTCGRNTMLQRRALGLSYCITCPDTLLVEVQPLQDTNPKSKFGAVKPSPALIPSSAILHEAKVFALGAKKYGPYNWRKDPVSAMTYLNAALRHLQAIIDGTDVDPESGASHAAHARACLAILIDAKECGKLIDDRPPAGPAERLIAEFTEKL